MKQISAFAAVVISLGVAAPAAGQDTLPQTLFTNVNVFDGVSETLASNRRVLVEGNLIKRSVTKTSRPKRVQPLSTAAGAR